jgi:dTDP-4-dehydrorhamnose 3,5-epimerase
MIKNAKLINKAHDFRGLYEIKLDTFSDNRGKNFEIYSPDYPFGNLSFNLDSCSMSKFGVLRGFHGDFKNWKLIQCLFGTIQLYIIDLKPDSWSYKEVKEFILSAEEPTQILIPPQVVNAHLCLSADCVFYYKWSEGYAPISEQIHLKWNDPEFKDKVKWKIENPIISDRDK